MEEEEWNIIAFQYADHWHNRNNYLIGDVAISYAYKKSGKEDEGKKIEKVSQKMQ